MADDEGQGEGELRFARGPLPLRFRRRTVVIPPGDSLPYVDADWAGALVLIDRGTVDLECQAGGRRRFGPGDLLWMDGLGLRRLHNPGGEPTVLVAVYRSAL